MDTETARSLRRRESKHKMRAENNLLVEENRLLRRTVADLEADRGPSFDDGYFTATYEVLQGLPADFDLHAAFGWSREQILARAGELASPDRTNPPRSLVFLTRSFLWMKTTSRLDPTFQKTRVLEGQELEFRRTWKLPGRMRE